MLKYTFSTIGIDGLTYYPKEFKYRDQDIDNAVGLLDFAWTMDIKEAMTWPEESMVETIAIEYYNTEIIEITEDDYKVIKTME